MLKTAIRATAGRLYWASPHFLSSLAGKVIILSYHRVIPRPDATSLFTQAGMFVTPRTFELHLQLLATYFEVLSFDALLDKWKCGDWNERARYAVITFDDGWVDNYEHAFPLLRRFGLPATVFLPTSLVGTTEWLWTDQLGALLQQRGVGTPAEWDAEIERAKTLSDRARAELLTTLGPPLTGRRLIDWRQAYEMSRFGITFGSHTSTHANLTRLSGAALDRELREPLEVLRREDLAFVPVLAYPNGDHSDAVVQAARAAGYHAAVTTNAGAEGSRPFDRLRLRRIGVHDDVTQSTSSFAFHVARQACAGRWYMRSVA